MARGDLLHQRRGDLRREVVHVAIVLQVRGPLGALLEIVDAHIGVFRHLDDEAALEVEAQLELAALAEVGPHQHRVGRPHEDEARLRMAAHQRKEVGFEALQHPAQVALRLLEALVEVVEVEVLDHALHRKLRGVAPIPGVVAVLAVAHLVAAEEDVHRLAKRRDREHVGIVVPAPRVVQIQRQRLGNAGAARVACEHVEVDVVDHFLHAAVGQHRLEELARLVGGERREGEVEGLAGAEGLVDLACRDVLQERRAHDGAVEGVVARDAGVLVALERVIEARRVAGGDAILLEGIDTIVDRARDGEERQGAEDRIPDEAGRHRQKLK